MDQLSGIRGQGSGFVYIVTVQFVHHHHVAGLQPRAQNLIQIGEEYLPMRGRLNGDGWDTMVNALAPSHSVGTQVPQKEALQGISLDGIEGCIPSGAKAQRFCRHIAARLN